MEKWLHAENNKYKPTKIYCDRPEHLFKIVVEFQPEIIDNDNLKLSNPTSYWTARKKAKETAKSKRELRTIIYSLNKEAIRTFAIEYQSKFSTFTSSYEDLAWWGAFFEKYGRRYGLLTEFRENGIC